MLFVDDVIAGIVKHWVKGKDSLSQSINRQCANTFKIWAGLFKGSTRQILSRFTWEIIQTVFGFLLAHIINLTKVIGRVESFHGCTVLEGGGIGGSLCTGTYIILYPGRVIGDAVTLHEYGHALQSRMSGPLYFFKYGISSLLDNRASWVEADANYRAAEYFGKEAQSSSLKGRRFATSFVNPKWWEYLLFLMGIGIILIPILNYKAGR
jgi:hypothetical protein